MPCLYITNRCRAALETVDRLTESLDFTDYASRIIHPIVRTLDQSPDLRPTAMDTLSSLVFQLGKKVIHESRTTDAFLLCVGRRLCELLHLLVSRPQLPLEQLLASPTPSFVQQIVMDLWVSAVLGIPQSAE